jgi:hypothetical protein
MLRPGLCILHAGICSNTAVFATDHPLFGGGSGTSDDPLLIKTPEHLAAIITNSYENADIFANAYFKIGNDIDRRHLPDQRDEAFKDKGIGNVSVALQEWRTSSQRKAISVHRAFQKNGAEPERPESRENFKIKLL